MRKLVWQCALVAVAGAFACACIDRSSLHGGDEDVDARAVAGDIDASSVSPPIDAAPAVESCNGVDDDRDGQVDETCSCTPGATQACWPGNPAQRGVGICADGVQTCTGSAEFGNWGPCEGAAMPGEEIPDDGVDQDCNGIDAPSCIPSEFGERCDNAVDDDCDELVDCFDVDDCADDPACEGVCIPTDEVCNDDIDNDCDGLVDCDDTADCADDPFACTCVKQCPPGTTRWCDEPTYCLWGKQTCNPDGTWGTCVETLSRPWACGDPIYDTLCCVLSGECCQAFPGYDSVGDCPPGEIVCEPTWP